MIKRSLLTNLTLSVRDGVVCNMLFRVSFFGVGIGVFTGSLH
jgi:hypothetical protein